MTGSKLLGYYAMAGSGTRCNSKNQPTKLSGQVSGGPFAVAASDTILIPKALRMEEPPENETLPEKWARVQRNLQEAILSAYPNPDRIGCPGAEVLKRLVSLSLQLIELEETELSGQWEHVTHCSPCYGEYLVMRRAELKKSDK
jgi:hypothetical protein